MTKTPTATRFCTACQAMRDVEGGIMRQARRTARWICKCCVERRSESIYKAKSGQAANIDRIFREIYGSRA